MEATKDSMSKGTSLGKNPESRIFSSSQEWALIYVTNIWVKNLCWRIARSKGENSKKQRRNKNRTLKNSDGKSQPLPLKARGCILAGDELKIVQQEES